MSIIYTGEKAEKTYKQILTAKIADKLQSDEKVIYFDADLMNCIGTLGLYGTSDRVVNCGIAEANMIGMACGTSIVGFKPITHSFGVFASRRCFDQVFLSGGYAKNNLTVIGSDSGVNAASNGGTHMPLEDIALYRAIPGAQICDTSDSTMAEAFLDIATEYQGVSYLRTGRKEIIPIYSKDHVFEPGKGIVVREGTDAVIIACGIMVQESLKAAEELDKKGVHVAVIDPFTIKPLDEDLIREYVDKCGVVLTAENHNIIGGLTSAVQAAIVGMPCKFGAVAVNDRFGEVGTINYLKETMGLTSKHIVANIETLLETV